MKVGILGAGSIGSTLAHGSPAEVTT